MKLVITPKKLEKEVHQQVAERFLNKPLNKMDYDGLSKSEIRAFLKNDKSDTVIVTADTRYLSFVGISLTIEDVYLYDLSEVKPIQECTDRKLRIGHNLMKLYDSGEFER